MDEFEQWVQKVILTGFSVSVRFTSRQLNAATRSVCAEELRAEHSRVRHKATDSGVEARGEAVATQVIPASTSAITLAKLRASSQTASVRGAVQRLRCVVELTEDVATCALDAIRREGAAAARVVLDQPARFRRGLRRGPRRETIGLLLRPGFLKRISK